VSGRYLIRTYGCQMNERDSEIMAGQLTQMGYEPAAGETDADLVVINTCAIRDGAEQHAFGYIGQLKGIKDARPGLRIAVAGCMAQEPGTIAWLKRHAPHVDLVFGTHNLHQLPDLLERVEASSEMVVDVWQSAGEIVEHLPSIRAGGARAYVNIIYGCDKFCTYCIVPFTRGREQSRRPAAIVAEVRALAREGYQDITLLGQNVNSYGHDLDPPEDLAGLLAQLDEIEGVRWIRYLTSHPKDFSQRLIDTIAGSRRVARHVHLPVQSGSSAVLKKMNRKYTREQYLDLVDRVRAAIPDAALTTDVIVGFPGETEEDFLATLSLMERVEYDTAFTFIYSARAGTPAARWEGRTPVPDMVKKDRLNRLMALQYRISLAKNQQWVGRRDVVLVEGVSKKNPDVLAARSGTNKVVLLAREPGIDLVNRFVPVRVTGARTFFLTGERVGEPLSPPLPERPPRQAVPLPLAMG
jgi:tRNA-2-methylthio-N6-dimethylallyladenosine synthase